MKKITDFIIDKRYFIIIIAIVLTIVAGIASQSVTINYDIAKYLPDTSKTRIGMNLMEEEFKEETSTLNIMFANLKSNEKTAIKKELAQISGVKSVTYDKTNTYNKGKYTLYILTIDGKNDSPTAKKAYQQIRQTYQEQNPAMSGDVYESNKTVLPFWIVVLAVGCALLILLVMCESYVEPFLFLTTILMAVILNKGTNIFFPSVSHITNSITAILQMALSMDYSIMLMNRYHQEKAVEKEKVTAMKHALHKAFQSISSSSVTTIVGLLALVFMSFKIGKDLGFILAKGVLFSLLCIFFVLPSLILLFDKWIDKTKKKSPTIRCHWLGNFSYHCRFIALPLFALIFLGSFLLKGYLGIDYTDQQEDAISKVFQENNQMVILYPKQEEKNMQTYLKQLENEAKIEQVLGYSNTIHERLTSSLFNQKLQDLGTKMTIDDTLLKIIYYDYHQHDKQNRMTMQEFVQFMETEAYQNPMTNQKIDANMKKNLARLKNFAIDTEITRPRTFKEIAELLEIEPSKVEDLFVYYCAQNNSIELSLSEFVQWMQQDILSNQKYQSQITQEEKEKFQQLQHFTTQEKIQTKMTSEEMAAYFGIEDNLVQAFYQYSLFQESSTIQMSLATFSNFLFADVLENPTYAPLLENQELQEKLVALRNFSQQETISTPKTVQELAALFSMTEEQVNQILLLKNKGTDNENQYTLAEFLAGLQKVKTETTYLEEMDTTLLEQQLQSNSQLLLSKQKYTVSAMADFTSLEKEQINFLYHLIAYVEKTNTLSPYDFVRYLLENSTLEQSPIVLSEQERTRCLQAKAIMDSSLANQTYTYQELAQFLSLDEEQVQTLYTLYLSSQKNVTFTPVEFVQALLAKQNDALLAGRLSPEKVEQLRFVQTIMESVLKEKRYDEESLSNLLGLNQKTVHLLYGVYDAQHLQSNQMLSIERFVHFLLEDVMTNASYQNQFQQDQIKKLHIVSIIMQNTQQQTTYTSEELFTILSPFSNQVEKNLLDALYTYYGSVHDYQEDWTMTVEDFVNYLNDTLLQDERFQDLITSNQRKEAKTAKATVKDVKKLLVGKHYARVVLNTTFPVEEKETFQAIQKLQQQFGKNFYVIGNSPMAYEMSQTFHQELNLITIITMLAIFAVVAVTFHSILIPFILVLIIQCAVYLTMGILSITGENVYFISLLIVQSILMGATIDYAILYTSYYLEYRKTKAMKEAILKAYQQSLHTILTSSSILMLVTLIIASFTSAIAAKICKTISQGTLCSTLLILFLLPAILACCDRFLTRQKKKEPQIH